MAADSPPVASAAQGVEVRPAILASQGVEAIFAAGRATKPDCQGYRNAPPPCAIRVSSPVLDAQLGEGKHTIWFPRDSVPSSAGWTSTHLSWAVKAMEDSAKKFEELGDMPAVNIYFTPFGGGHLNADDTNSDACFIGVRTPMQQEPEADFKQRMAGAMAYCMIAKTFPEQLKPGWEVVRWWGEGLDIWLSSVVYGSADLELENLPDQLAAEELGTTLLERSHTNWLFFEHSDDFVQPPGNIAMIKTMPTSGGRSAQEDALAGVGGIKGLLETCVQGLSDEDIPDSGGGFVSYDVPVDEAPISGPTVLFAEPQRFGVERLHVEVDPGKTACVEYEQTGDPLASWRTGASGESGSWSGDLPDRLEGEAVFVVTATEDETVLTISVTGVADNQDCEHEESPGATSDVEPCKIECEPSGYHHEEG